jgi:hydrolase, NUDIX family
MFRRRYKPILREADKKFIKYKKTGEIAMKKLNVIIVFDKDENKILMCKRTKEPYKGKLNLVGGKVEKEEDELHAAYRELEEETGIKRDDIKLINVMNFNYKLQDMELEVYAGRLNKEVKLVEEINKLLWVDKNDNFFDIDKYAGEGNIGHMLRQVEIYKDEVLK